MLIRQHTRLSSHSSPEKRDLDHLVEMWVCLDAWEQAAEGDKQGGDVTIDNRENVLLVYQDAAKHYIRRNKH